MYKPFTWEVRRGMRLAFTGFAMAIVGVLMAFSGLYFKVKMISQIGFFICTVGVVFGFSGVCLGWIDIGKALLQRALLKMKE